jgi:mono/diheme cytochrome c family protein
VDKRLKAALLAVAALGVAIFAAVQVWPERTTSVAMDASDAALVSRGAELYAKHCAECHGADLEGQPNWRERSASGRLPAPPHDASGHTWHHPAEQLFALTKAGIEPFAPEGYESDMPAFAGKLSDADIWAVLSFIKSRWPEDIQRRHGQMSAALE